MYQAKTTQRLLRFVATSLDNFSVLLQGKSCLQLSFRREILKMPMRCVNCLQHRHGTLALKGQCSTHLSRHIWHGGDGCPARYNARVLFLLSDFLVYLLKEIAVSQPFWHNLHLLPSCSRFARVQYFSRDLHICLHSPVWMMHKMHCQATRHSYE